ncbi:MAG: phage tail tape measure protein, partial [Clostridia bacterium]|nr:phage tail tape measure protein [Clostridia bacterium]
VSMMGETFKYVAPLAGTMGYSVEDMATAIGTMANSGIKGGQAGTALRAAITRLVKPTDDAAAAMARLGLDGGVLTEADGNMRSFSEVVSVLRDAFSGLDASQQAETAALLFGQEAMSGMLAIINTSEADYNSLAATIDSASEAMGGIGAAAEMAATQLDNLQGDVTIFQSAFDGLKTAIYDKAKEPLRDMAQTASEVMSQLTDAINNGGLSEAFSTIGDMIGGFVIDKLSDLAGQLGPFGEAIQTAGAAVSEFAASMEEVAAEKIADIAEKVQEFGASFAGIASDTIGAVAGSVKEFLSAFESSDVGKIIGDIADHAADLFGNFLIAGESVIKGVASGIQKFFEVFDEGAAVDAIESVAGVIADLFAPFSDALGSAIKSAGEGLGTVASKIGELAGHLANGIAETVKDLADSFEKWAPWVAAVAGGLIAMQIVSTVSTGFILLKSALVSGELAAKAMAVAQGILNAAMNANPVMLVVTAIGALAAGLVTAYAVNEDFRNSVNELWTAFSEGAKAAVDAVGRFCTEWVPEKFNSMLGWFKEFPSKFW